MVRQFGYAGGKAWRLVETYVNRLKETNNTYVKKSGLP
jgi:hypothetical protein